jgi:outer membrane protein OmpA-like peptidoglycan-associated protein
MFCGLITLFLSSCNPQKKLARQKHEYMESTYVDIKKAVVEADVTILNDTLKVLFPENLLFQKGGATIFDTTYPIMERFAGALLVHNKTAVLINGHTDNTGSDELNEKLSKDRADAAAKVLAHFKVPENRLSEWGFGSRRPIAENNTEAGRTKNRRVEFIILYKVEEK